MHSTHGHSFPAKNEKGRRISNFILESPRTRITCGTTTFPPELTAFDTHKSYNCRDATATIRASSLEASSLVAVFAGRLRFTSFRTLFSPYCVLMQENCGSVTPNVLAAALASTPQLSTFEFGLSYTVKYDELLPLLSEMEHIMYLKLVHYLVGNLPAISFRHISK